jgi:hypothetical protein
VKKLLLLAGLVLAAGVMGWLPATQKDVGSLVPVETLVLTVEDQTLVVRGDGDVEGRGGTWAAAMDDLRATTPGDAFFGATGHVIFVGRAVTALPDVLRDKALRPAARVYVSLEEPQPESATKFLDAHPAGVTLQDLQAAALEGRSVELPQLEYQDGRYHLYYE